MTIENINEIISQKPAVMLYFSGIDCGVCEVLKPKIKDAFDKNFENIEQIYIQANENKEIAANFGVFTVPTVLVYLDSKEFIRKSRAFSIDALVSELQRPYQIMNS